MERMQDLDPVETGEWVDSLRAVLHHQGSARATYLLEMLAEEARRAGIVQPSTLTTPYVNTIPPEREERADWDRDIEHRIRSIIRWNAIAIILRANKESSELGGHIASFQSAATLYDIGFGHFWQAPTAKDWRGPRLGAAPLRARLRRGPAKRRSASQLPAGDGRPRPLFLPASLADARVLAVPHRLHGA